MDIYYRKQITRTDGTVIDYIEGGVLSTETKPAGPFALSSRLIEADRGKVYFYTGASPDPWEYMFTYKDESESSAKSVTRMAKSGEDTNINDEGSENSVEFANLFKNLKLDDESSEEE